MEAWMIIILIIGGIIAIAFNIWNKKNPVGGSKKITSKEDQEQNERILKQWKEKEDLR